MTVSAATLHEPTGSTPFFVSEVVATSSTGGGPGVPVTVPDGGGTAATRYSLPGLARLVVRRDAADADEVLA